MSELDDLIESVANDEYPDVGVMRRRIERAERLRAELAALRATIAQQQKRIEELEASALTKAFSELASTVDAIRTQEMEQSAMTKIADESGNEPPIGVQP